MDTLSTFDWGAVAELTRANWGFHRHHFSGGRFVGGAVEWNRTTAPAGRDFWWSMFDACGELLRFPGSPLAAEVLLAGHARLIHYEARKLMNRRRYPSDADGAELFATGLQAVWKTLSSPRFDTNPDKVGSFIGTVARNAMLRSCRRRACQEFPADFQEVAKKQNRNWSRQGELAQKLQLESTLRTVLRREDSQILGVALAAACTEPGDSEIVDLWFAGLKKTEIAKRLGVRSRHSVARTLARVLSRITDRLPTDFNCHVRDVS